MLCDDKDGRFEKKKLKNERKTNESRDESYTARRYVCLVRNNIDESNQA